MYALVLNGYPWILFTSETQASPAEELMGRAAQVCRAMPLTTDPAIAAPNLADTLRFSSRTS